MLFDLRGRGRRRTVQSVYLFLAVLIGVGLVGFGVGGAGGGLFNSNNNNSGGGGGSGNDRLEKQLTRAEKAVKVHPRAAGAWANLAHVRFQVANSGGNLVSTQGPGTYTSKGRRQLRAATRAWAHYRALESVRPDPGLAAQMSNAFRALGDAKGLVGTLEIQAEQTPSAELFRQLAEVAYAAGQGRKGDLAAAEALKRAAKGARQQVKAELQAAKSQAKQGAPGSVPQTSTVPVAPKPKG